MYDGSIASNAAYRPARRHDRLSGTRVLKGEVPELVRVEEEGQTMTVPLRRGQKGGAFLDLRGARRFVRGLSLPGARVLDLFSYTGTLGAAAERAGAGEIWHVDASRAALELGFVEADAFRWVRELASGERFDLVLADPPQMTSRVSQVPSALQAYRRLYRALAGHVAEGGTLLACCCTSRIDLESFRDVVRRSLGEGFRLVERLPPEPDHPVAFREADYLKVLVSAAGEKEQGGLTPLSSFLWPRPDIEARNSALLFALAHLVEQELHRFHLREGREHLAQEPDAVESAS